MSKTILPLALNVGLNTSAPPLMAPAGSLIDCLNYEISDTAGYRRIDGYEAYDGFCNGAIYEYYRIRIIAVDPANQALIVPDSVISREEPSGARTVTGTVLSSAINTNRYDVAPTAMSSGFGLSEEFLLQQDGSSFINLQSGAGFLRIVGPLDEIEATFYVTPPNGTAFTVKVSAVTEAADLMPVGEYLTNLRSYSSQARARVVAAPAEIAGMYWLQDRLYAAVNAQMVTITVATGATQPVAGVRVRWNGTIYRMARLVLKTTTGGNNIYTAYLYPITTTGTVDNNLVEVNTAGTAGTTWITNVTVNGSPSSKHSDTAFLGYFATHSLSNKRGFVHLTAGTDFKFNNGKTTSALGFSPTFQPGANPSDAYYVVGDAGATVMKVRVTKQVKTSGDFVAGTAVGEAQVVVLSVTAGTRDYVKVGDALHNAYPTTASSKVADVQSAVAISYVAGTAALDLNGTRYQWETANFYGQEDTMAAYGTTGAGSAFWVNQEGYGSLTTSSAPDKPKYIAFHKNCLALGFAKGSVLISVEGEPYNFNGIDGALEIATGDAVTGLLELPGDTLAVFGRRAIRRITGAGSNVELSTIAGHSGCFDYTAILLGADAVFTGINGITTLQQTAAYGDFAGKRLSDPIINWLRPKLVSGASGFEAGGVVMAYPVRSKNQYRLCLASGEVVAVSVTSDEPKITIINHSSEGKVRYPLAWSSETGKDGKERVHVRWQAAELATQVFELESGWGFNGKTFNHYFDLSHIFSNNAASSMTIEKVRLFGKGYGLATLDIKSAGIEDDFEQDYHEANQDISLPRNVEDIHTSMRPVTSIIDQANWGIGIKLRFKGTMPEGNDLIEPAHICQAVVLHIRTEGVADG